MFCWHAFKQLVHSENVVRDPLWPSSSGWEVELSSNIGRYQQNFQMDCCTQRRFDFSFQYAMASNGSNFTFFSWPSNVDSTKKWNIGLFNLSFVVFIEKDVEAPPTPSNCVCRPPWLGVMFHIHSPNLYQDNDFPDKRKNSCKRGGAKWKVLFIKYL